MTKRNIVLVCGPGAMQGVFGAGVLAAFEDANLYPRIKIGYGISAGAVNLAYHFAHQTRFGSSIYTEKLTGRKFIKSELVPIGIFWRWINRYVTTVPLGWRGKPVDIDYLFETVMTEKVPLNISTLKSSLKDIEFKMLLSDPTTGKNHYVSAQGDTLLKLKAATALVPYYNRAVRINEKDYVDGSLVSPFGIEEIMRNIHQNDKLVVISNFSFERGRRHHIKDGTEAWVTSLMFDGPLPRIMKKRVHTLRAELEQIQTHKNTFVVHPSPGREIKPNTTDKEKLVNMFRHGFQKGMGVVDRLK